MPSVPKTRAGRWCIQIRTPGGGRAHRRWRDLYPDVTMDEALHRWGRICSRARTGQSGRRGEARLIDGRGGVVEEIDIDAMVRAAGARAVHH